MSTAPGYPYQPTGYPLSAQPTTGYTADGRPVSGYPPAQAPPAGTHTIDENKPKTQKIDYIVVYGHSNLLYWWPVWLVSFILAGVTYFDGHRMAVTPPGTVVERDTEVPGIPGRHDVLVAPEGKSFQMAHEGETAKPGLTVSGNNSLGVVFVATLVVVALASTILLRGLVSVIAVVLMITAVIALAFLNLWNPILAFVGGLDIRMNAAGYLAVGIPLLLAWLFVVFVYDRQVYMVFDSGQIRYVLDVGDSEVVIPAEGASVEKKRNDVFRHWLLGFGTGDLVIRFGGSGGRSLELENVVGVSRKLVVVNQMLREKAVTVEA